MTTRIEQTFARIQEEGKKALIPYVMGGDPNTETSLQVMHALVEQGADMIELGLPFSDPMADGPTVALAGERALAAGTSTKGAIELVAKFRETNTHTPVILMGYLNPIEFMGYEVFAQKAQQAGADGVLMVDLPPEQATDFSSIMKAHSINTIFLISPTTTQERMQSVLAAGSGYIYYVSLKGVTGSANIDTVEVSQKIEQIKQYTDVPVCVGFGIKNGESAKACAQVSDGVVIGSELVRHFADDISSQQAITNISEKISEIRNALDSIV